MNFTALLALIVIGSPVAGLRPERSARFEALKLPKPAFDAMTASSTSRGAGPYGEADPSHASDPLLPSETRAFWLQLGGLGLAMSLGFMRRFLYVMDKPSAPAVGKLRPNPATPHAKVNELASPSSPSSSATVERWSLPPRPTSNRTSEPAVAVSSLDAAVSNDREPSSASSAAASAASPREPGGDSQVDAVEHFYRALSAADARTAAAFVIPAKRGLGAFNEAKISKFYGSFGSPLVVRSILPIGPNLVEARYSYRVSRTTCQGTAIVETERVGEAILIRRIHANC